MSADGREVIMVVRNAESSLTDLYEIDETAWLDEMARLTKSGRIDLLDLPNLSEFLSSMAKRERREILSRLTVLLQHLLKWEFQPDRRSKSWEATIRVQRRELQQLLESAVLRSHAVAEFERAYTWAVQDAMSETDSAREAFPEVCPFSFEEVLSGPVP